MLADIIQRVADGRIVDLSCSVILYVPALICSVLRDAEAEDVSRCHVASVDGLGSCEGNACIRVICVGEVKRFMDPSVVILRDAESSVSVIGYGYREGVSVGGYCDAVSVNRRLSYCVGVCSNILQSVLDISIADCCGVSACSCSMCGS